MDQESKKIEDDHTEIPFPFMHALPSQIGINILEEQRLFSAMGKIQMDSKGLLQTARVEDENSLSEITKKQSLEFNLPLITSRVLDSTLHLDNDENFLMRHSEIQDWERVDSGKN